MPSGSPPPGTADQRLMPPVAIAAALASGLLLTAAFPNVGQGWAAWIALVPFMAQVRRLTAGQAFRLGMLLAWVHYCTLVYWLLHTMSVYGGLPLWVGVPLLLLITSYGGLYLGLFALAVRALRQWSLPVLGLYPCLWVALEVIRSHLFTGMPWAVLGYSQHACLPLIQTAAVTGVYGLSFLVVAANAALMLVWEAWRAGGDTNARSGRRRAAVALVLVAGAAAGVAAIGYRQIRRVDRQIAAAPLVRVGYVQGNIDQGVKWDRAFRQATVDKYAALSIGTRPERPELLVWPETAAPFYLGYQRQLTAGVLDGVRKAGAAAIVGSPAFKRSNGKRMTLYNSAFLVTADGRIQGRYDKSHLVPFGEYVPLGRFLPFVRKLVEGVGDFKPGPPGRVLPWGPRRLGVLICYEAIFPELARRQVENGADLLVNITNDAWYGRTSAPYQHFSMAVFRAVENRRAMVRSANTGISGFIDPVGRVSGASGLFTEAAAVQPLPVMRGRTLYNRWGDVVGWGCVLVAAAALAMQFALQRRRG
jgi:apolipoprotein N-acyltransferase